MHMGNSNKHEKSKHNEAILVYMTFWTKKKGGGGLIILIRYFQKGFTRQETDLT